MSNYLDVGILRDTLLPSFTAHATVAGAAYVVGRFTDRVDTKDWAWPLGFLVNMWYSAAGRRLVEGQSLSAALNHSRPEGLILGCVTLWSARQLSRIAIRSIKRGEDDPRYGEMKKQPGFWNKAVVTLFGQEALVQTLISLPFVMPFRSTAQPFTGYHPAFQALAVGMFCAGFGLEALADAQMAQHQASSNSDSLLTEGVWSLCRHPNYLGDALFHLSIPLLLYSSDMLSPIELLGPIANFLFLRFVGGTKEMEDSQAQRYHETNIKREAQFEKYRSEKNAMWPSAQEISNQWAWVVIGLGAFGVAIEQVAHAVLEY